MENEKTDIDTETEKSKTYLVQSSAYTKYKDEFNNLLKIHIHSSDAEFEASLGRLGLLPSTKRKTADLNGGQLDKTNNALLHESPAYNSYKEEFDRLLREHINGSDADFEASLRRLGLLKSEKEELPDENLEQKAKRNNQSEDHTYNIQKSPATGEENSTTDITGSPLGKSRKYRVGLLSTVSSVVVKECIIGGQKNVYIVDTKDCLCMPLLQILRRIGKRLFGKKKLSNKPNKKCSV